MWNGALHGQMSAYCEGGALWFAESWNETESSSPACNAAVGMVTTSDGLGQGPVSTS